MLVDAVCVRGTGSWAGILEQHRAVFHRSRSSVDLKDKWRNLVKVLAISSPGTSDIMSRQAAFTLGISFMCVLRW